MKSKSSIYLRSNKLRPSKIALFFNKEIDLVEIRRSELAPLCSDDQCICIFQCIILVFYIIDFITQHLLYIGIASGSKVDTVAPAANNSSMIIRPVLPGYHLCLV